MECQKNNSNITIDNNEKRRIQEIIYRCSQSELKKIVECILFNKTQSNQNEIKYTKNARGYFFNINTIPNDCLIEIKYMLENFELQKN
jgi:hypothetical protein